MIKSQQGVAEDAAAAVLPSLLLVVVLVLLQQLPLSPAASIAALLLLACTVWVTWHKQDNRTWGMALLMAPKMPALASNAHQRRLCSCNDGSCHRWWPCR